MHLSCAICAEVIGPSDDLDVTPCGHMFHTKCMATWMARSQTCPQCRNRCTTKSMVRLYLNVALNETLNEQDTQTLQSKYDAITLKMRETTVALKKHQEDATKYKDSQKMARRTIVSLEAELEKKEMLLKTNIELQKTLQMKTLLIPGLQKQLEKAKEEIERANSIHNLLNSTTAECEAMMKNDHSLKALATMVVVMKREVRSQKQKVEQARLAVLDAQSTLQKSRHSEAVLREKVETLESDISKLREDARKSFDVSPNGKPRVEARNSYEQSIHIQKLRADARNSFDPSLQLPTPVPKRRCEVKPKEAQKAAAAPPAEESNSPYLKVSKSSIGLSLMAKNRPRVARLAPYPQPAGISKPSLPGTSQYSIFSNARLNDPTTKLTDSTRIFNGMGGTERRDLFVKVKPH